MTVNPNPVYDDEIEIDLREIVLTLWRRRWIILAVTLATALIAFVISFWVLPKQYQAEAYLSLNVPLMDFKTTEGITISQTLPDIKSMTDLATSPGLLKSVLADPTVAATWDAEPISITDFGDVVKVSVVGQNLLRLQVTDTDPQRVALLSNVWAGQVAASINNTYGVNAIAQSIGAQVTLSQQAYEQAQTALKNELSRNRVDALTAQLNNEQADLTCVMSETSATTRVLNDLQVLKQRLEALPAENGLSLGDALALTTLQQRALSSQVCAAGTQSLQVQIGSDVLSNLTPAQALESIAQIQGALQTWQTVAAAQQAQLEQNIPQLKTDLETAADQLRQLTTARDQAWGLYVTLTQQQKQINTTLTQGNQIATLSIQAVAPEKKSSPKVVMNTALAGIAGLILSALWVLALNWWRNSEK